MSLDLGLIALDILDAVAIVDEVGATADVVRSHFPKRITQHTDMTRRSRTSNLNKGVR